MHAWSSAELGRFLEATAGERAGALWMLLATTGMRRGELLGLRWADVDVDAKTVTVRQTVTMVGDRPEVGTRSRRPESRVSIDAGTVTALRAWKARRPRSGY